jgi:uncharacterized protein (DUF433 family)
MAHQLHLNLPDDQYQTLVTLASQRGMTPEELAAHWLSEREQQEGIIQEVSPGIVSDPRIHQGAPVIKGTRIQAILIAELIQQGTPPDEIREDYRLNDEQMRAALMFAESQNAEGETGVQP